ncbi:MAG: rRNA pseudouridine synthase [Oscillospiraceae bacterium]|nr:rRNA pseudouridine synthase [Oscillospiraceae bacterium]
MNERIQKILSARGVASRRKAEEMMAQGRVSCNGRVCALGDTADPAVDEIRIDGNLLPESGKQVYILLHKPRGYVTTLSDEKGRPNAAQLVADCGVRVYPVGRLDMDSEGLLLFTNDGDFANALMHPKHEVNKTYRVAVKGYSPEALERMKRPVTLDGYTVRPPQVSLAQPPRGDRAQLLVTIHEGRNRQVRRMCAMASMEVLRLVRIAEGCVELGSLPAGKWRYLTAAEVERLRSGEK